MDRYTEFEQKAQRKRNIRMKLAKDGVVQSFLDGNGGRICPRCGSNDYDWEQTEGGLDEGWEEHTLRCCDCHTIWVEYFECKPQPTDLYITEIAEERVSDPDSPYSSHHADYSPEELDAIVEAALR